MLSALRDKILAGKAHVCVIGLGRIGIPLSLVLARSGFTVIGVDTDKNRVDALNKGQMPFHYPAIAEWLKEEIVNGQFSATIEFKTVANVADIIIVTVGTPTGIQLQADYSQLHATLNEITKADLKGKLLIIRSTAAPCTFMNIIIPTLTGRTGLSPNVDFAIAVCPERILEGQAHRELYELPELVGTTSQETAELVTALFNKINPKKQILIMSPTAAELGKLFTNVYRYVNFALANEFAIWAEKYGEDAQEIINAANVGYERAHIPRVGFASGPCLGKDSLLLDNATTFTGIISAAWKLNEAIPYHVVERLIAELSSLQDKRILVLGLGFKAESDDLRFSPSVKLVDILRNHGAVVTAYEPHIDRESIDGMLRKPFDVIVLATNHSCFRNLASKLNGCASILYDVWGMYNSSDFTKTRYLRLGRA